MKTIVIVGAIVLAGLSSFHVGILSRPAIQLVARRITRINETVAAGHDTLSAEIVLLSFGVGVTSSLLLFSMRCCTGPLDIGSAICYNLQAIK